MSNHKSKKQNSNDNTEALYQLLERLEKRDEVRRYRDFNRPQSSELVEEREQIPHSPEAGGRLVPARFQPDNVSDTDLGVLLLNELEPEEPEDLPAEPIPVFVEDLPPEEGEILPPSATRRRPLKKMWEGFAAYFPHREDSPGTKARKYGFLVSLLVMVIAAAYLLNDLVILPTKSEQLKQELISSYHPEKSTIQISKEQAEQGNYPVNMLASFVELYNRNDEVRGWIEYQASGKEDFLGIQYPIVYSGDNEKYLDKDFDGKTNKYGTLFFDKENRLDHYTDTNRALIVYGHDMAGGQMFGGLHKLMGNVQNARAAATLKLSTLFETAEYQVFAVILTDEDDTRIGHYFNTRRTSFEDDDDFLNYIAELEKRSMFDYPVEVDADDQILVLSTCTRKSTAKIKNGRLVVVARRVQEGDVPVDLSAIVKKSYNIRDENCVLMPYAWYINQKLEPHPIYTPNGQMSNSTTTTTDTATDSTTQTMPTQPTYPSYSGIIPPTSTETDDTNGSMTEGTDSTTGTDTGDSSATGSTTGSTTGTTSRPTSSTSRPTNSTSRPTGSSTKPTTGTTTHVHQYKITDQRDATCTEDGIITFTCAGCKDAYNDTVPALGHNYNSQGLCTRCGSCKHQGIPTGCGECPTCGEQIQHVWNKGNVVKEPTCTEPGKVVYTCQRCGETHTDESKHDSGSSAHVGIQKESCTEPGEYYYVCQDCGTKFLKDEPPVGYHVDKDDNDRCDGCGGYL